MNTTLLRFKMAAVLTIVLLNVNSMNATTLFENFDNPGSTVKSYTGGGTNITYPSGGWYMYVNVMTESDNYNGTSGVRIRGYAAASYTTMMFNKTGGAGVVSFKYGSYSSHSGGEFVLQKSTDNGANWADVGTKVTVPKWNGTFLTHSVIVNEAADVRFRISMTVTTNANTLVNIDDFMITDFGTEQVAMPTSNVSTGIYETPQTVTLSSTTSGATIYYTTDGTQPTNSSSVYSTPLNITSTTKIRMIAAANGKVDSRENTVIVNIPIAINSISEFYSLMPTTGTNLQYYKYTGEAVISFVYWASSTSTAKKIVLQDNSGGVIIDDNYKFLTATYSIGDKVTGIIAQVINTNDAPILYPTADFTVLSNNNSIVAKVITMANVTANTYQLVQFNDLFFDAADGVIKFGINSFRVIHDASTPISSSIVYNTPSLIAVNPDYIGTIIPTKTNLIALIMRNNPINSGINNNTPYYSIFPRSMADIGVPFKPFSDISQIKAYNLSTSGNSIYFETAAPETVKVFTISGQAIKNFVSEVGRNTVELAKGIYIIHIGDKTTKVVL